MPDVQGVERGGGAGRDVAPRGLAGGRLRLAGSGPAGLGLRGSRQGGGGRRSRRPRVAVRRAWRCVGRRVARRGVGGSAAPCAVAVRGLRARLRTTTARGLLGPPRPRPARSARLLSGASFLPGARLRPGVRLLPGARPVPGAWLVSEVRLATRGGRLGRRVDGVGLNPSFRVLPADRSARPLPPARATRRGAAVPLAPWRSPRRLRLPQPVPSNWPIRVVLGSPTGRRLRRTPRLVRPGRASAVAGYLRSYAARGGVPARRGAALARGGRLRVRRGRTRFGRRAPARRGAAHAG